MPSPSVKKTAEKKFAFQVTPRLLSLLGEQLIRDANLAVFELVKNAYDANSTACNVTLHISDDPNNSKIIIQDNGDGMDENILKNIWMMIGTDNKAIQREKGIRTSPPFNRFPLGEKGLGRLSIHKLGRFIRLTTRMKQGRELVMEFDLYNLEKAKTFDRAFVTLQVVKPSVFAGVKHGTRLEITHLKETWTRGELRRLHRAVNSLCSPYKGPVDFKVVLAAPGNESWLDGLFTAKDAYSCSTYHISGYFENNHLCFDYVFTPPSGLASKINKRDISVNGLPLERKKEKGVSPSIDLSLHQIGRIDFEFWLYDRDPQLIRAVTDDIKGLKDYLDDNGGIRIYRDGIRVYDFGEPGNDWLNLDIRRVNTPTAKTSNYQMLGTRRLDAH